MKRLIINADDFGLSEGCNTGILEAIKNGIVTSTTLLINGYQAEKAIKLAKNNSIKELGLHLTLTSGKPLSSIKEVPSLVTNGGKFYRRKRNLLPNINFMEAKKELKRQIEKFLDFNLTLTHIDTHHHLHMKKGIKEIIGDLAQEYKVPVRSPNQEVRDYLKNRRIKTTDYFSMKFYDEKATYKHLTKIIDSAPQGITEIMVHPGYVDGELNKISSYNKKREKELKVLTNQKIKKWLEKKGVKLIGYEELGDLDAKNY